MNINKCICTGRLTKDPVLRAISDDMKVCELRLAVDGMGRGREVGFINVSVFGKAGEAASEYLAKGWLVAIDGRLEFGQWETDGGENGRQACDNLRMASISHTSRAWRRAPLRARRAS
jgi:single-strand DNA-binding protein